MSELVLLLKKKEKQQRRCVVFKGLWCYISKSLIFASGQLLLFSRTFIFQSILFPFPFAVIHMWCYAVCFVFFLSFDTNVFHPWGSKILYNISGTRLWDVTTEHAEGHDSNLSLSVCDVLAAHPVSSVGGKTWVTIMPAFPVPQERIVEPILSSHLVPLRKDALGGQRTRCATQWQTSSAPPKAGLCFCQSGFSENSSRLARKMKDLEI